MTSKHIPVVPDISTDKPRHRKQVAEDIDPELAAELKNSDKQPVSKREIFGGSVKTKEEKPVESEGYSWVVVAVLVAVILILIVVVVYMVLQNNKPEEERNVRAAINPNSHPPNTLPPGYNMMQRAPPTQQQPHPQSQPQQRPQAQQVQPQQAPQQKLSPPTPNAQQSSAPSAQTSRVELERMKALLTSSIAETDDKEDDKDNDDSDANTKNSDLTTKEDAHKNDNDTIAKLLVEGM